MLLKTACRYACVVAMMLFVTRAASAQNPGDVKAEIEKANQAFVAAFAKGDAAAIASMYSSDARVFPPNSEVIQGAEAIQKLWKGAMDMGVKSVKLQTTELEAHGTVAHEVGSYMMIAADGKQLDRGKYIVIWKRSGTEWKLHRDIWNTSMPAAAK